MTLAINSQMAKFIPCMVTTICTVCVQVDGDGLMVQCEVCLSWQHGHCTGLYLEEQVRFVSPGSMATVQDYTWRNRYGGISLVIYVSSHLSVIETFKCTFFLFLLKNEVL